MTALNIIRQNFGDVLSLRQEIANIFESLDGKINALKTTYTELLNTHENMRSLFGIDSFYFQNELLEVEYNNMNNIFTKIDNRLYCEYYNLFRMIQNYIVKDIKNKEIIQKTKCNKEFPIFKHLDKIKRYDIKLVIDLQNIIISSINELESYLQQEETYLNNNSKHAEMGLNIDNLLHYQRFSNVLLKEKINMYIQYLNTFHIHHTKYYTRLLLKLKLLVGVVNEDILIKQSSKKIADKKKKTDDDLLNRDYKDNIQNLINEISPETKSSLNKALSCITTNIVSDDETTYDESYPNINALTSEDIKIKKETKELVKEAREDLLELERHYKNDKETENLTSLEFSSLSGDETLVVEEPIVENNLHNVNEFIENNTIDKPSEVNDKIDSIDGNEEIAEKNDDVFDNLNAIVT